MNIILIIPILVVLGAIVFLTAKFIKQKELYKNKKFMIISGSIIAIAVIIIVVVVIVSNNGTTRYAEKMKSYLEKIGYNCDGVYKYEDGYLDTEGKYFYCQMTTANGIYKEVKITKNIKNAYGVVYNESVSGAYHLSVLGQDYNRQRRVEQISYIDDIENKRFNFLSRGINFYIGEQVNCDNELKKNKEICEDAAKDVNSAMREFESYFSGAGLKLE